MKERLVYMDGLLVPESEARISILDSSWMHGDKATETTVTFNHKPFKLHEHIERLCRSMKVFRIDSGIDPAQMEKITHDTLEANLPLLGSDDEYLIYHSISAGVWDWFREDGKHYKSASVVVHCWPLDYRKFAKYYKTGVHAVTPSVRHIPPQCLDPKVKHHSRILFRLADYEVKSIDPEGYVLLLDIYGNIAENIGGNFFIVTKGKLRTPGPRNVLCGISRETALELAQKLGIPAVQEDIQMYDVYNADEAFFTSTPYSILPATKINGLKIGNGTPGPITNRLLEAWSQLVGVNIVERALSHLARERQQQ